MKNIIFTTLFYLYCLSGIGQTVSNTYNSGNIPLNYYSYNSSCNGAATPLTVTLPSGGPWQVTSIDVKYDITTGNGAYMSEQKSRIKCQNTNIEESSISQGNGSGGTYNYNRSGLTIANDIYSGGTELIFELQAWRTWGNEAPYTNCDTHYQLINDESWQITVHYIASIPMSYSSSTCIQTNTNPINPGTNNGEILELIINTNNSANPFALTSLDINLTGTTSLSDITTVNVFYTGSEGTFATSNPFATNILPSAGIINITGNQNLSAGENHFWIAYTLSSGATIGNFIDAECIQINMNEGIGIKTPSTTSPIGKRTINFSPDGAWPGYDLGSLSCPSVTTKSDNTSTAADDCSVISGRDHVYKFTLLEEAQVDISLCDAGTNFDTEIYLFSENASQCDEGGFLAWDDSSCESSSASELNLESLAAGTYILVIGGSSSSSGTYNLSISVSNCETFIDAGWSGYNIGTLSCPYNRTFSDSTNNSADNCTFIPGPDHIYSFSTNETMRVNLSLCNSETDFDTHLSLYDLTTGTCSSGNFLFENNDHPDCGNKSKIDQSLPAGNYVVIIEGMSGSAGQYEFSITASNDCESALGEGIIQVNSLPYTHGAGTNIGAGNEIILDYSNQTSVPSCSGSETDDNYLNDEDVVFIFTPSTSGDIEINMNNASTSYASLFLYEGCPLNSATTCGEAEGFCIGRNSGYNASITTSVISGTTYYLVLDGYSNGYNYDNLTISAPTNCTSSLGTGVYTISLPYSTNGKTCGGVNDLTSSNITYCGSSSYLYEEDNVFIFTPDISGNITISYTTDETHTGMKLYEGCPLNSESGTCIGSHENSSNGTNTMSECVEAGKIYYLILDSYYDCFIYSDLTITSPGCNTGTGDVSISSLPYAAIGESTNGAGNDITATSAFIDCWIDQNALDGEDKVYSFTPVTTGEISIDIFNQSSDGISLTLYEGCPQNLCNPGSCTGYLQDYSITTKTIKANVESGVTYYLLIDSYATKAFVSYDLSISAPTILPDNKDYCTTAPLLTNSPSNIDLDFTGIEDDYPSNFDNITCLSGGKPHNNMWYKIIPTSTDITLEFNNTSPSTSALQAELYESTNGKCGTLTSVATYCNNTCTTGDFTLSANVIPGKTYYLMIDGCAGATPTADLTSSGISSGTGESLLPVELNYFNASCTNKGISLSWETLSEINNSHFDIEYSTNGKQFIYENSISGAGNSFNSNIYTYHMDIQPDLALYFRLKQMDYNGSYKYSQIISKNCSNSKSDPKVFAFPNPSNNTFNLMFEGFLDDFTIAITNISGKIIYSTEINAKTEHFTLNSEIFNTSGIYFLHIYNRETSIHIKLIKSKK